MQLSARVWGGVLALGALVTQVMARQVWGTVPNTQDTQRDTSSTAPSCQCSVNVDDDRSPYNMGVIHTYTDLGVSPGLDKDQCRKLRHHCKHECALRADLSARTERGSGPQLGYMLCLHHGQVTSTMGLGVTSYPVLEGCAQHHPITPTVATQRLCCGHTSVSLQAGASSTSKQYTVFGWNLDCQAQTFVLH